MKHEEIIILIGLIVLICGCVAQSSTQSILSNEINTTKVAENCALMQYSEPAQNSTKYMLCLLNLQMAYGNLTTDMKDYCENQSTYIAYSNYTTGRYVKENNSYECWALHDIPIAWDTCKECFNNSLCCIRTDEGVQVVLSRYFNKVQSFSYDEMVK